MDELTIGGAITIVVVWIGLSIYAVNQFACLEFRTCGADDLWLAATMGLALIPAAILAGMAVSVTFPRRKDR